MEMKDLKWFIISSFRQKGKISQCEGVHERQITIGNKQTKVMVKISKEDIDHFLAAPTQF